MEHKENAQSVVSHLFSSSQPNGDNVDTIGDKLSSDLIGHDFVKHTVLRRMNEIDKSNK